jgi:ATPase subunit of ABC transporter with duplicated ATPase domains
MRRAHLKSRTPLSSFQVSDGMAEDALLVVTGLSAGYDRPVVGPVSFSVRRGEIISVRGPNGSGKSTLLNALAGGAHLFSGTVSRLPGVRISHQQQAALPLDHVPLSGRELLALTGADTRGLPDWIAPLVGKRLDRLSGGQLQFMQVWACLKAPVDIVLLDEPTNNVDPAGVQHLQAQIEAMKPTHALLVISHDHAFLDGISTRTLNLGA